jgi:hypothetical protein
LCPTIFDDTLTFFCSLPLCTRKVPLRCSISISLHRATGCQVRGCTWGLQPISSPRPASR